MADKKDYYEVLGVTKNATDDEIKKARNKLAAKYQNPASKGDADVLAKMKEINEAYDVLKISGRNTTNLGTRRFLVAATVKAAALTPAISTWTTFSGIWATWAVSETFSSNSSIPAAGVLGKSADLKRELTSVTTCR